MRDEALKNSIKTDTQAPGMYSAYMPLKNADALHGIWSKKRRLNVLKTSKKSKHLVHKHCL